MGKLFTAAKSFGQCVGRPAGYSIMTGALSLFVVTGGPIRIRTLGFLVTTLMAGTNTLKFQHTPYGGSADDLCGTTDTDAAAANQLFVIDGVKGTALVKSTAVGVVLGGQSLHNEGIYSIIVGPGSIKAVFSATSTAGVGQFFMEYTPLSHLTKVQVL